MRVPKLLYRAVRRLVPIACVDALPYIEGDDGAIACVGLIKREAENPGSLGWALVGGGVQRGETIEDALLRHLKETLVGENLEWELPDLERPGHAAEYFPDPPAAGRRDPRKHAIAVAYPVRLSRGEVTGWEGEAEDFQWKTLDALPSNEEFAFGHGSVVRALIGFHEHQRRQREPVEGAVDS